MGDKVQKNRYLEVLGPKKFVVKYRERKKGRGGRISKIMNMVTLFMSDSSDESEVSAVIRGRVKNL